MIQGKYRTETKQLIIDLAPIPEWEGCKYARYETIVMMKRGHAAIETIRNTNIRDAVKSYHRMVEKYGRDAA